MERPEPERWTVIPHEGSVLAYLDAVPALIEWEPLLDEVRRYAANAHVIVLDGPGWLHPLGRSMERALRQTLEGQGVRVASSATNSPDI